jgi:hypothetical protein
MNNKIKNNELPERWKSVYKWLFRINRQEIAGNLIFEGLYND